MNVAAVASAILAIIEQYASSATVATISNIITVLENLVPFIINEAKALYPIVVNVISALKSNSEITPDQLQQLQAQEQKWDADMEAALAAAEAEDAAADAAKPQ